MAHQLNGDNGGRVTARTVGNGGNDAGSVLAVTKAPHRIEVAAGVESQPIGVDGAVEVDGELGDAQPGLINPHQHRFGWPSSGRTYQQSAGKAEIAVGAGWNPGDTVNSGALFYLEPPADRTARWTPIRLPHEPTMHRIRWVKDPLGWALWSVPLHGRGNKDGQGVGARIQRYRPPADRRQPWTVETVADQWHKTHNFDPVVRSGGNPVTEVLVGSAEGAFRGLLAGAGGAVSSAGGGPVSWTQVGGPENGGVGEIRSLGDAHGSVAGISPMHGNQLVIFHPPAPGAGATTAAPGLGRREVLDDGLIDGHALACGDLLGIGQPQIVAGWRAMGRPRSVKVGVALYVPVGNRWMKVWVDDDGMACEDLTLADLDGDGRLDIVASGRSTHNLKVYFNESPR